MSGYSWEKLKSEHRKNAKKLGLKFGNFGWVGTKDSILSKTDKGYFGTTYVGPGKYKNEFETYESIRKNGSKLMKRKTRKNKVVRRKRGVVRRNSSHSDLIDGAVDVIINTRDFCGNEKQAVRDYCFENKVSDCKGLYRMAMAKANSKWNAYRREAGVRCVRRNPAIPANMNNPKYVKVLKLAQMRARNFGEPFGVYAYEGMDGPTFIARKPGEWPERYGELVTLITPKGKRGLRGNPSREVLSQKKELVRIASEVALNIINHFGPSYEGGYVGVANSPLLPRSIRAVIDTMSQPFDAPNAKNKIMYYPKSYDVQEWQKGGNLANHIWHGQTDRGHDEVIRKGIAIAKAGNVFKNRQRGLRGNPRLGKYEQKALNFARKYPGWHGFDPRKPTANIVRRLEKKGLVKVSDISNQFRAI